MTYMYMTQRERFGLYIRTDLVYMAWSLTVLSKGGQTLVDEFDVVGVDVEAEQDQSPVVTPQIQSRNWSVSRTRL